MAEATNHHVDPDFAALYETDDPEDAWPVTPRLAYRVWYAAQVLADEWQIVGHEPEDLAEHLPVLARPFANDEGWLEQFGRCFEAIEDWFNGARGGRLARCTGEEMAFHMILDLAEAMTRDGELDDDVVAHLPGHGTRDADFDVLRDYLLEDSDVLMLFMPHLDGIDEQEPLLHPSRWFVPFYDDDGEEAAS